MPWRDAPFRIPPWGTVKRSCDSCRVADTLPVVRRDARGRPALCPPPSSYFDECCGEAARDGTDSAYARAPRPLRRGRRPIRGEAASGDNNNIDNNDNAKNNNNSNSSSSSNNNNNNNNDNNIIVMINDHSINSCRPIRREAVGRVASAHAHLRAGLLRRGGWGRTSDPSDLLLLRAASRMTGRSIDAWKNDTRYMNMGTVADQPCRAGCALA